MQDQGKEGKEKRSEGEDEEKKDMEEIESTEEDDVEEEDDGSEVPEDFAAEAVDTHPVAGSTHPDHMETVPMDYNDTYIQETQDDELEERATLYYEPAQSQEMQVKEESKVYREEKEKVKKQEEESKKEEGKSEEDAGKNEEVTGTKDQGQVHGDDKELNELVGMSWRLQRELEIQQWHVKDLAQQEEDAAAAHRQAQLERLLALQGRSSEEGAGTVEWDKGKKEENQKLQKVYLEKRKEREEARGKVEKVATKLEKVMMDLVLRKTELAKQQDAQAEPEMLKSGLTNDMMKMTLGDKGTPKEDPKGSRGSPKIKVEEKAEEPKNKASQKVKVEEKKDEKPKGGKEIGKVKMEEKKEETAAADGEKKVPRKTDVPGTTEEVFDSDDEEKPSAKAKRLDLQKGPLVKGEQVPQQEQVEKTKKIMEEMRKTHSALSLTTNDDIIAAQRKMKKLKKQEEEEEDDEDKMILAADEDSEERKKTKGKGRGRGRGRGRGQKKNENEANKGEDAGEGKDEDAGEGKEHDEKDDGEKKDEREKKPPQEKGRKRKPKTEKTDEKDEGKIRKDTTAKSKENAEKKGKPSGGFSDDEKDEDEKDEEEKETKAKKARSSKPKKDEVKKKQSPMKQAFAASRRVMERKKSDQEEEGDDGVKRKLFGDTNEDDEDRASNTADRGKSVEKASKKRRLPDVSETGTEANLQHIPAYTCITYAYVTYGILQKENPEIQHLIYDTILFYISVIGYFPGTWSEHNGKTNNTSLWSFVFLSKEDVFRQLKTFAKKEPAHFTLPDDFENAIRDLDDGKDALKTFGRK